MLNMNILCWAAKNLFWLSKQAFKALWAVFLAIDFYFLLYLKSSYFWPFPLNALPPVNTIIIQLSVSLDSRQRAASLSSKLKIAAVCPLETKSSHQMPCTEFQQVSRNLTSLFSCYLCISGPSTHSSSVCDGNIYLCQECPPTLVMETSHQTSRMVIQIQ